jgi:hypothetical protein
MAHNNGEDRDASGKFLPGHRVPGNRFQPGQSGNARGAPRLPKEVRVLAESARAICDQLEAGNGVLPLEFLISVFHDKKQTIGVRLVAAIAAMPYLHCKMPVLAVTAFQKLKQPDVITPEQLDALSERELELLEGLLRKILPQRLPPPDE